MTETFHAGPNLGRLSDVTIIHGDCLEAMAELAADSVDAIVTDPPYGLGFMGKAWDELPPGLDWAKQCLRVLKPGGHLLAFGGTRTWHRLAVAVEDAGFEIRDSITWLYGSGFPKSLDVSKAIDKTDAAVARLARAREFQSWLSQHVTPKQVDEATSTNMGYHYTTHPTQPSVATVAHLDMLRPLLPDVPQWVEEMAQQRTVESENFKSRAVVGVKENAMAGWNMDGSTKFVDRDITEAHTPEAEQWQGWGTALKPGHEPCVWARKPFSAVPLSSEANRLHHLLGGLLWLSLSPAKRAELTSQSSRAEQPGAWCVSVLASAVMDTSQGASGGTDTFSSQVLASTSLSIASSWSSTLDALSAQTRTSTTSTRSSTTTGLRILSSLLAPLTSRTTMPACECLTHGPTSSAPSVASSSTDDWWSWLHTLSASVPETATEGTARAVESALAAIADELSGVPAVDSSAPPTATTRAAGSSSAFEPVVVGRKPFKGNVAANVLTHGTGALNIDACRIETTDNLGGGVYSGEFRRKDHYSSTDSAPGAVPLSRLNRGIGEFVQPSGRWPANVILDESQAAALDEQSGALSYNPPAVYRRDKGEAVKDRSSYMVDREGGDTRPGYSDKGGASRFFYCAKAPKKERPVTTDGTAHPTVKPLALMRWLVRLVTPPGGVVLDPFAGSGTTVEAALLEDLRVIGIEREADYLPMIQQRIARCLNS